VIDEFHRNAEDPERISAVLERFRAGLAGERVSLADVTAALNERSVGAFLLLLSIPTVSPIPLGPSMLFNLPLLLYCLRLVVRPNEVGLPAWLARRSVARETAERLLDAVIPRIRRFERFLRPRPPVLADIDRGRRFRLLCLVLAIVAFAPLPLMGWLPGFALIFMALGLIERDGRAVALGLITAVAAVVVALGIAGGMTWAGFELWEAGRS